MNLNQGPGLGHPVTGGILSCQFLTVSADARCHQAMSAPPQCACRRHWLLEFKLW